MPLVYSVRVEQFFRRIVFHAQKKVRGFWFRKEKNMSKKKVSGKTHTKEQLDNWANQNNPNNKAYRANADNHSNQLNPNHKKHQQRHTAARKKRYSSIPIWAPDYPEIDD